MAGLRSSPITIPSQIRAGRALLDWPQTRLAEAANIALSAVKSFESERPGRMLSGAGPMREALEHAGVVFLMGDASNGPGVRLTDTLPNIIRRPTGLDFYEQAGFMVEWRGQEIRVQVPGNILDDLDRANHETNDPVIVSFEKHKHEVLKAVMMAAADTDRFRPNEGKGTLQLTMEDFPALSRP